MKRNPINQFNF